MKEQFVPYELAVKLKELGFDEECFASIDSLSKTPYIPSKGGLYKNSDGYILACPLWQQAFDWLWNKYSVWSTITPFNPNKNIWEIIIYYKVNSEYNDDTECLTMSYEEARKACLEKLIEITQTEHNENI